MDAVARMRISPTFRMALLGGAIESVRIHLQSGEDVNACDEKGRTALILAATRGHYEICRLLLQEGANRHARDDAGNDAAATARSRGHLSVEQLIMNWEAAGTTPASEAPSVADAAPVQHAVTRHEADVSLRSAPLTPIPQVESITRVTDGATVPEPPPPSRGDPDGFDLSGWEEDVDSPVPADDPTVAANASALQKLISRHVVVDTDEAWDDVEIDLPDPADLRPKGIRLSPEQREDIRLLIVEALRDGRITAKRLRGIRIQNVDADDDGRADFQLALKMVLGDLGILVDDADAPDPSTPPTDRDEEEFGDAAFEALSYLARHLSGSDELYFRFLAEMPKDLLSRAEEVALAEQRDAGVLDAMRALAACDAVVAKLSMDLKRVISGAIPARAIIEVDAPSRGEASQSTQGEDDHEDEAETEASPTDAGPTPDLETIGVLLDACRRADRDPEHLARCLAAAGLQDAYFRDLCHASPPGSSTRGAIVMGLKAAEAAEMELVQRNLRLVAHVAKTWGGGLPRMDRIQDGTLGLIRAARKFSGSRGNKFATYAVWWIRQAISRAAADTRHAIRLPVHLQDARRKVTRALKALEESVVGEPSLDEIATECGLPPEHVRKLLRIVSQPISFADAEDEVAAVADPAPGPDDIVNQDDLRREVAALLSTLDPRSERVVRLRFGIGCEEHTLEEVGQMYQVTRERIRQIEAKALRQIGHPARSKHLRGAY
jgi:RNA polymerase primary sigma factor